HLVFFGGVMETRTLSLQTIEQHHGQESEKRRTRPRRRLGNAKQRRLTLNPPPHERRDEHRQCIRLRGFPSLFTVRVNIAKREIAKKLLPNPRERCTHLRR